jgi:hypothetical protein
MDVPVALVIIVGPIVVMSFAVPTFYEVIAG